MTSTSESTPDTKERLLDAAEALFAESGFAETSLRDITAAAGANLASVNYHFGSKDALLEAVFARRIRPVNSERLSLLSAYKSEAGPDHPVPLEKLLWAFLAPPFERMHAWGEGGRRFMQLVGRMNSDPSRWAEFFMRQFDEVKRSFEPAFARALPELSPAELTRRIHYVIAGMSHTFCWGRAVGCLDSTCAPCSNDVLHSLIGFAAYGLRAPEGLLDIPPPATAAVTGADQ